jgi:hypothetical protein
VRPRSGSLAAALTAALATTLAVGLVFALSGCSSGPAGPVESVKDLGDGRSAASVAYDGLTLTLIAPASAVTSAPVRVTLKLDNTSGKAIDLGSALVGVRGFAQSAPASSTTAAFEAGLDAASPPAVSIPAGGSRSMPLTFTAPAQGIYTMRGVFGSAMRVKGNTTPPVTLTVR